jgi:hypothetical protein
LPSFFLGARVTATVTREYVTVVACLTADPKAVTADGGARLPSILAAEARLDRPARRTPVAIHSVSIVASFFAMHLAVAVDGFASVGSRRRAS